MVFVLLAILIVATLVQKGMLVGALRERSSEVYGALEISFMFGWDFFLLDLLFGKYRNKIDSALKFRARCMFVTWTCEFPVLLWLVFTQI